MKRQDGLKQFVSNALTYQVALYKKIRWPSVKLLKNVITRCKKLVLKRNRSNLEMIGKFCRLKMNLLKI